jgi:two-component system chemotaxis response regulator CheY
MSAQILIADDDPSIRALLKLLVERAGFTVELARDGIETLQKIEEGSHLLVLLDLQMPRVNGFDVIESLRAKPARPVVLVVTALAGSQIARLDPAIVHGVIRKPFDVELLGAVVSMAAGLMVASRKELSADGTDATSPAN